ncbi:MAG: RidA family protein [Chloroflexota bacterium]|nr:RidA family protein [Chloroflexota bacterium]
MKTFRNPTTIHQPLASYTHQIEIQGAQRWLVLSGQIGMDKYGELPSDPIEQFKLALTNIYHNLEAANMEIGDLVKLSIYLVGDIDSELRREVLSNWLYGHKPSMTLLYVAALASSEIKVELEALACADHE